MAKNKVQEQAEERSAREGRYGRLGFVIAGTTTTGSGNVWTRAEGNGQ